MADVSFDDLIPAKDTTAPSKGADISFDDLIPKTSTTPAVEGKGGAAFGMYPKPGMKPQDTISGAAKTAGESFVRSLPGTAGFLAGAGVAEGATSFVTTPLAVANPIAGGLAKLAINMTGGFIGAGGATKVAEYLEAAFDPEGFAERKARREQYPTASSAGEVAAGFAGSSYKTAPEVAGKFFSKPIVQRGTSAALMGSMSVAEQVAEGKDVDLTQAGVQTAGGFALPGLNTAGKVPFGLGEKLGTKLSDKLRGVKASKLAFDPLTTKLDETSTPEQQADFLKMVEIKAKAPLVETAFKNKKTGEVTRTGPKHPDNLKADDNLTQGFVDELDVFHTRDEAVAQAKRAGQIPQDHVLENPPNEEAGLHSGDLRKTGNKKFEVTAEQPAGVSTAKPEWEQLQEHTKGATNVGQAIDRILAVPDFGNNSQRSLLQAFNSSPFIRDADISFIQEHLVVDGKKAAGSYIGGEGKHEVALAKDGNINTLIHEATHAGTQRLLQEGNHPAAKRLNDLFNEFKNREEPLYEAKLEAFKKEKGDKLTLKELNTFRDQNTHYGLDSVEEFVSEALSNDDFKKFLADTKSKGTGGVISNMLKNIRDAIYDGLGIEQKDRSALDDVLEHTSELLEASKDYTRDSNGKLSISPNRISQMVHDDLEKEGIAVAHTSPHKFDKFDWIKHHLKGEGAMVKGAGTYMSQGDKVNEFYVDMAKEKALDKWLNKPENRQERFKYDSLQLEVNKKLEHAHDIYNDLLYFDNQFEDIKLDIQRAEYDANLSFEDWIKDNDIEEELYDSERLKQSFLELKNEKEQELTKLKEQKEEFEKKNKNEIEKLNKEQEAAHKEYDKAKNNISSYIEKTSPKVPTYHSTIEAKPEEFLDWDSTKQSKIVSDAFKKLGIESANNIDKTTELKINQALKDGWYGNLEEDGSVGLTVLGRDYAVEVNDLEFLPDGTPKINSLVVRGTGEIVTSFEQAKKSVLEMIYQDQGYTKKTGEELYRQLSNKFEPKGNDRGNLRDSEAQLLGDVKASIALAELGVVGNVHNAAAGREKKYRNYVVFNDSRIKQNLVTLASRIKESISEPASKAVEKIDPRSIPNEEEFFKHAVNIYEAYGPEEAVKFFEDYNKNLKERTIPVPNNNEELDDATHKLKTFTVKDIAEKRVWMDEARKAGVTEEDSAKWFMMIENGEELPTEALKWLGEGQKEAKALYDRAVAMKKLGFEINIGTEFFTGQSRIRLWSEKEKPGWKETLKKFFSNDGPMGDKVGDEVDAAIERKVYQLDDGRVVEIHRQPKDVSTPEGTIKKGTEIWEWKDGVRKQIGHTPDLNFKRGDKVTVGGKEVTMVDGKVPDIEKHSPYKYSHDALASQAMAVVGLRKLIREAEFIHNLKKSEMFEKVGFSPDKPLEDLPKGWKPPDNIDKIPQLRGWHFDPKTAAIIEDFAKVWNDNLWSKLSNAIVKNMMLNPVPHMFNEVMHLFVARGFTGWVDPRGVSSFVKSANRAVKDVGNQTKFFREVLTEGGTPLSADARNKGYFDNIFKEESKKVFGDPVMQKSLAGLAKKLGTNVGNLYNGISNASQKAMWFTRDVMYFQYLHETMDRYEKRTGNKMDLKDAIDHIERHMPNYRMPSEVLGNRSVAKILKNPNVSLFARYHYGMVKSLVNTLKDVDPRNLSSPEGRQHFRDGVDSMLAIAIAMGFLYPLADKLAEAIFGEGAEQRRAGPFHLIQAAMDVSEGKKDASALIWPVLTFNPMLLMLVELGSAHKLTTGKAIYHIQDSIEDIASDIGQYAVKQVPQAAPIMSATAEEEGDTKLLARQFDIKVKTEKEKEREARAKKYQERTKKGRDTKRAKGTYNP